MLHIEILSEEVKVAITWLELAREITLTEEWDKQTRDTAIIRRIDTAIKILDDVKIKLKRG